MLRGMWAIRLLAGVMLVIVWKLWSYIIKCASSSQITLALQTTTRHKLISSYLNGTLISCIFDFMLTKLPFVKWNEGQGQKCPIAERSRFLARPE